MSYYTEPGSRNFFWVVEESVDGGESWFPLFGEHGCCTRTKREAKEWIAHEKALHLDFVLVCNGPPERMSSYKPVSWRVVRYIREEK